ncbi:MAG: hypothetical protein DRN91_06685 [Candidatus Alkanophagales archaeon]|nr:MAG: hypothetical protein DRN91_06685 [Candidatus Alkanophagales archaeon]
MSTLRRLETRNKERQTVKCMKCGLEARRDAVGCINIRLAQGESLPAGSLTGR